MTFLLLIIDPILIITVIIILGVLYGFVYYIIRNFLSRIGKERVNANRMRYKSVSEAFGAVKEIKLGNLEQIYIQKFSIPAQTFFKHQASSEILKLLPRFARGNPFGGILIVILYLMGKSGTFEKAIPIIALYTFCGYRLMPAVQQIYIAISQFRYNSNALNLFTKI